jgi:hypothetical protein
MGNFYNPVDRKANRLSEGNQRVLLHRARSSVRLALVGYLDGDDHALPQAA